MIVFQVETLIAQPAGVHIEVSRVWVLGTGLPPFCDVYSCDDGPSFDKPEGGGGGDVGLGFLPMIADKQRLGVLGFAKTISIDQPDSIYLLTSQLSAGIAIRYQFQPVNFLGFYGQFGLAATSIDFSDGCCTESVVGSGHALEFAAGFQIYAHENFGFQFGFYLDRNSVKLEKNDLGTGNSVAADHDGVRFGLFCIF